MRKQTVNLVTWNLGVGGIEVSLLNYIKYLSDDFDFRLYSLRPVVKENILSGNTNVSLREGSNSTIETYRQFYDYAKAHQDQVFHLFNGGPILLEIAKRAGVQNIIYHFHGTRYWTPNDRFDKFKSKLFWNLALRGDLSNIQFIANSHYCKRRFFEQVSRKPTIGVVYNGFECSKFDFDKKDLQDEFKIVVVGRLIYYKNLMRLIKESKHLFEQIPNCKIYFVGNGSFKAEMQEEINRQGLQDRFEFTGVLTSYQQMYQDASAVVSVSFNESFGNTLVEGILSETPVFASDIPAHKEILEQLPEFIIRLEDNIGNQLVEKINNIEFFKDKAKAFRENFSRRFGIQNHIHEFKTFYSK